MAGLKEFIPEFGKYTFEEVPFCEGDAVLLTREIYMPFEQVVSSSYDEEPKNFVQAAEELFELRGYRHYGLGLMITSAPSRNMVAMSEQRRYADMKIYAMNEVLSISPSIQYCSGTFILPDGTLVVCYRGTDDSVAGWKEDLDIYFHNGTPSYNLALNYIENVAKHFDGNIIICGHSKGGNIALYTALKCSEEVRHRIVGVYNCDGPGYHDYGIFHLGTYEEILPVYKHFVPNSSTVGMLMAHDYDYKAVKSTRLLGPFQHDLGTWQIENGKLVTVPDISFMAKATDVIVAKLIDRVDDSNGKAIDTIVTVFTEGLGQNYLTDVAHNVISSVKGVKEALKNIDPEVKETAKSAFAGTFKLIRESVKSVKDISIEGITKLAYSYSDK